jgi:hypothetical protein
MAAFNENSSSLVTSSDSDFSGFDPVSDEKHSCKLFIIKHDSLNDLSDVSDISSIANDISKELDNGVD